MSKIMTIIIFSAPQGWGKSQKASGLMQEFGCKEVVEDWRRGDVVKPGAMHLTHQHPDELKNMLSTTKIVARGWGASS